MSKIAEITFSNMLPKQYKILKETKNFLFCQDTFSILKASKKSYRTWHIYKGDTENGGFSTESVKFQILKIINN